MTNKLTGRVEKVIYRSPDSDYSVVRLDTGFVIVGNMPAMLPGDEVSVEGQWTKHPKFGHQFIVKKFLSEDKSFKAEFVNFLSSGVLKGIRTETALAIVKKFGNNVFDVFNHTPEKLLGIKGIGPKKLETIKEEWKEIKSQVEPIFFLVGKGVPLNLARKIYKTYRERTIEIVKNNPYQLIKDIWGVGFDKADKIAEAIGFEAGSKERIKAWLVYYLDTRCQNGNVFIKFDELYEGALKLMNYQLSEDDNLLFELETDGEIIIKEGKIYPSFLYYAEREVEDKVEQLSGIKRKLDNLSLEIDDSLSEEQSNAVVDAFVNGITIITGGPGTGKTTSIKSIFDNCMRLNLKCSLAAPTGRAAKRISEVIGGEAKTIHRMLEYNPVDNSWNYNEDNPLDVDVLIVDEVSMIDLVLFYRLISAVPRSASLVLIGDTDQLPAIGPGNIIKDLIHSGIVAVHELKTIFRQAETSGIVRLSSAIKYNERFNFDELPGDVEFVEVPPNYKISEELKKRFIKLIDEEDFDPIFGTQIISPQYKGDCGVNELNKLIQSILNPEGDKIKSGENSFRINDKVMQLVNNYTKNVFNGDVGIIQHYDREEAKLYVLFENNPVEYSEEELDELKLAYAATVHKSQGAEYDCVILVVDRAHSYMLSKNLIYTAITRAKKKLIIIGSKMAFANGIRNVKEEGRNTSLFKMQ